MSVAVKNASPVLDQQKSENAKQRWKILREVIRNKCLKNEYLISAEITQESI